MVAPGGCRPYRCPKGARGMNDGDRRLMPTGIGGTARHRDSSVAVLEGTVGAVGWDREATGTNGGHLSVGGKDAATE